MPNKIKHNSTFLKGMSTDSKPKLQPEGTYRFALNAMLESNEGDLGTMINEIGNTLAETFTTNFCVIGGTKLDNDEFVLFLTDDTTSEIVLYNSVTQTPTTLVSTTCLGFLKANPIDAIFKIHKGCERIVYFTDGVNAYKSINLDSLGQYLNDDGVTWDCDKMRISRKVTSSPCIAFNNIQDYGGSLPVGTYQFAIRYLDIDLNPTNWIMLSNPIPITDESYNSSYYRIDGGVNSEDTTVEGYVPTTNKSIRLDILNLDTNFKYYQIGSMHLVSGTGEVSATYTDVVTVISDTTDEYTYTGNTSQLSLGALTDITIDDQVIEVVQTHAQLDNRLFLGNTTGITYDWATVQRAANLITTKWVSKEVLASNINSGVKGGKYYVDCRSWMRDEVYAIGIEGLLNNTEYTPAFHIPGRRKLSEFLSVADYSSAIATGNSVAHFRNTMNIPDDWDSQLLTVVATGADNITEVDLDDVLHLGFTAITDDIGDGVGLVQRWKVYNTATTIDLDIIDPVTNLRTRKGFMSYYECEDLYPDTQDCDGNFIYPNDGANMLPIRHHKFPDSTYLFHIDSGDDAVAMDTRIVPVGLELDLTDFLAALPTEVANNILEWRIVKAQRDTVNKTVLDKGYTSPSYEWDDTANPTAITDKYDNITYYDSPAIYLRNSYIGGSYIKFESKVMPIVVGSKSTTTIANAGLSPLLHRWLSYSQDPIPTDDEGFKQRPITSSFFIDPAPVFSPDGSESGIPTIYDTQNNVPIFNSMYNKRRYSIGIEGTFNALPSNLAYAGYVTLDNLQYPAIPLQHSDRGAQYYISIKQHNPNAYKNITSLIYYHTSGCGYTSGEPLFGGDIFITRFATNEKFTQTAESDDPDASEYAERRGGRQVIDAWYESEVNAELRHNNTNNLPYFPVIEPSSTTHFDEPQASVVEDYFEVQELRLPSAGGPQEAEYIDYYGYNEDYSAVNKLKGSFPLSLQYDFCSDCINDYPYRIHYSARAYQEQVSDNYRQFLTNNYSDLLGSTGPLNTFIVERDQLYSLTDKAIYFTPIRPQQLETNESAIYIGTGDVLSVPPKRLVSPGFAYGGTKDKFSVTSSEFGTVYVDREGAKVFLITEKLEEISAHGMKHWFKDNLPFYLDAAYKTFNQGEEYFNRGTIDTESIGFRAIYDPCHKRIILHKRDFYPIDPLTTVYSQAAGSWVTGAAVPVSITDDRYFINKSWTISYSLRHKAWVSFHSYFPSIFLNDGTNFYSTVDNTLYNHNEGNFQTYYGEIKPYILDYVINPDPTMTKTLSAITVISNAQQYDATLDSWLEVPTQFYNKAVVFNSQQSTTENTLTLVDDPFNTSNTSVHYTNREYHFNQFRNAVNDYTQPLWTSDWVTISGDYFIDKVLNPNIFTTKTLFENERLRDEWFGVRLTYLNDITGTTSYKLTTDLISATVSQSHR